jgi:branched-subunit amino acid transport protein AzlD
MDKFLRFFKWPLALVMLWSLPAAVMMLWDFVVTQRYTFSNVPPILIGFTAYMALWFLIFKRKEVGSYFSTLEHELTHAIFAILTGHAIQRIRVTAHEGGEIVYKGKGNWLITIAPYFFPTVTVLLLSIRLFIEQNYWLEMGIGASIAFHITSSYVETHGAQSDLKQAGKFFAFCFLPTANVLTYAFIAVYLQSGWQGLVTGSKSFSHHLSAYSIPAYFAAQEYLKKYF